MAIEDYVYLSDVTGPRGPAGPAGPPGPAGGSSEANAVTFEQSYPLWGPGIDWTGATDSSDAVQSLINGTPPGSCIVLGRGGVLRLDQPIWVTGGRHIKGQGWRTQRDKVQGFGHTSYENPAYFGGTVVRSNVESGPAFMVTDNQTTQSNLSGFVLIGPGSGTSTGIYAGMTEDGLWQPIINGNFHDVMVMNFNMGWDLVHVEESRLAIGARACNTGVDMRIATNNNDISLMNLQWCDTGVDIENTCTANTFTQLIGQNNTGTTVNLVGSSNIFNGAYFENSQGNESIRVVGGHLNKISGAVLTKATDRIVIEGNAQATMIDMPSSFEGAQIDDNGFGSTLIVNQSRTPVVGAGQRRVLIDAANQTYPWAA